MMLARKLPPFIKTPGIGLVAGCGIAPIRIGSQGRLWHGCGQTRREVKPTVAEHELVDEFVLRAWRNSALRLRCETSSIPDFAGFFIGKEGQ